MRKPQMAWAAEIDNTYAPFVPKLTSKPHSIGEIPPEIVAAQKQDADSVIRYGDHRQQKQQVRLPNPYQAEIEDFDQRVTAPTQVDV